MNLTVFAFSFKNFKLKNKQFKNVLNKKLLNKITKVYMKRSVEHLNENLEQVASTLIEG